MGLREKVARTFFRTRDAGTPFLPVRKGSHPWGNRALTRQDLEQARLIHRGAQAFGFDPDFLGFFLF